MAGRSSLRVAVDALVCASVVACGLAGWATSRPTPTPPIPPTVCDDDTGAPRYAAMHGLHVVAVFGEIADDDDPALASRAALAAALARRPAIAATIVGPLPRSDVGAIDRALAHALATPGVDVVYYNGHEYGGRLTALATPPPTGYRIAVLDTCWSTQRYGKLAATSTDVVGNSERAVTGSVASFVQFLDGLAARRDWPALLAPMNASAADRAAVRAPFDRYPHAEHYRHDVACRR